MNSSPRSTLTFPRTPLVWFAICFATNLAHADFALRDGDTVVFLGDSITAAPGYTKIVEHYTLMRYPERRVRFVNAGQGGDTASGCLARLERDVLGKGATVVTVAFGVNDIGWGMKADAEHKQRYLDGIRAIVGQCQARNVRPFICSAAITAEAPGKAEHGFLQTMTDEGLALAKSLGAGTIDLQRGMREIQRRILAANEKEPDPKKHTRLHAADSVHLNDLGQLAMAYAMLQGLGAPADVSSARLDAANGSLLDAKGCVISDVKKRGDNLDFVRLDNGLPLNLGVLSGLNHRWVPLPEGLNRYLLAITNLFPGEYEIRAEGRLLGKANADRLARGLNISSMTADAWQPGGPWDAQSGIVKELVDARDKLWMGDVLRSRFLTNHPRDDKLGQLTKELDDQVVALQRATAKPYPYHFEIRKAAPAPDARAEDLTLKQGVAYGQANGQNLLLDAYQPPDAFARPRAAVLFVHGGGWESGSRDVPHFVTLARSLAEEGFAVFSISYRLVKRPQNGEAAQNQYPAALDDCQRAVRWLRHHAQEYGIAPERIAALGDSAGGHLVALLGTTDTRDNGDPELARYSSRVNAVVDLFGPSDLTRPLPDVDIFGITVRGMVDNFLGPDPVRRREASPLFHVNGQTAPFLIFHGGKDVLVPIEHSRELHAVLQKAGRDSTCIEFPDEGHGFGAAETKARMLKETLQFLRRTLNGGNRN